MSDDTRDQLMAKKLELERRLAARRSELEVARADGNLPDKDWREYNHWRSSVVQEIKSLDARIIALPRDRGDNGAGLITVTAAFLMIYDGLDAASAVEQATAKHNEIRKVMGKAVGRG